MLLAKGSQLLFSLLSASQILESGELLENKFSDFMVIPELGCYHSGFQWREKMQSETFRNLLDI